MKRKETNDDRKARETILKRVKTQRLKLKQGGGEDD